MTETLHIEGHASLFDLQDLGGDVVRRGAFTASLADHAGFPMLFQHDPSEPVGLWREVREDTRGLHVRGELMPAGPRGAMALNLVRRGAVTGLSIGFRTRSARDRRPRGRDLLDIDLWEISLVTFPMLPQARLRLRPSSDRLTAVA